jgi:hypothetical protein
MSFPVFIANLYVTPLSMYVGESKIIGIVGTYFAIGYTAGWS